MAESKCTNCGSFRDSNLKFKCPSCGSKMYPLGGGYLYPKEGQTLLFMLIALGIAIFAACGLAIYYIQVSMLI